MSDSDHPFTPFAAFDSRPKIETAKPIGDPPNPFSEIPLPRAPRTPSRVDPEHDTDSSELQDVELGDDDKTPADPETPNDMILRKLNSLARDVKSSNEGSRRCYQLLLELHVKLDAEKSERESLARRVLSLELANRWVPRLAWLVTTAIAVMALLRTYR